MNLFIVRDFARTDSSEPAVQVWKKRKKASCLKKPYGKINYYMLFIFSKGGGREQHHFSAQHFNRGGGSRCTKFLHGRSIFQGPDVLVPIPMEPFTTCDFPVGPGHLLGKGWPLGSRLWCLLWVCYFPIGILGQVWYLIVSIPDLCNLITWTPCSIRICPCTESRQCLDLFIFILYVPVSDISIT